MAAREHDAYWWQAIGTAVAWMALFHLNAKMFRMLEWAPAVINWVFLPAAVRMLSILLFGWRGALGLWVGTVATIPEDFLLDHPLQSIAMACVSSLGALAAVRAAMTLLHVRPSLQGLTALQLTWVAGLVAAVNTLAHNVLFWSAGMTETPVAGLVPMFVGDVAGILLVVYFLRVLLIACERVHRLPPS